MKGQVKISSITGVGISDDELTWKCLPQDCQLVGNHGEGISDRQDNKSIKIIKIIKIIKKTAVTADETTTAKKTVRDKAQSASLFLKKNCTYTQWYFNLFTIYFIFCISGFIIVHCRKYIWIFYWTLIIALFHLTRHFTNHTYSLAPWHPSSIILWLYHQESLTYYKYKNCLETHETIHMLMTLVLLPFILPIRSRSFRCFIALYAVWIFKAACSVVFGSWKVQIHWNEEKTLWFWKLEIFNYLLVTLAKNQRFSLCNVKE